MVTPVPVEIFEYPVSDTRGHANGAMLVIKDLHTHLILKVVETVNSSLQLNEILENTALAIVEHIGLFSSAILYFRSRGKFTSTRRQYRADKG